jgi:hypothetical protein
VGLPLRPARARGGRVSQFLHASDLGGTGNRVAASSSTSGSVIPEPDVATGLSFHHAAPVAAPPQAVLLAAPPDGQAAWSPTPRGILLETLELAKLRLVDLDALGAGTAPAAWFAYNTKDDTVSTDVTVAMRVPDAALDDGLVEARGEGSRRRAVRRTGGAAPTRSAPRTPVAVRRVRRCRRGRRSTHAHGCR